MYKILRKDKEGNIEIFYTDDLQVKKILDTERKKTRSLKSMIITDTNKKKDLQQRQKMASDLRKLKIVKKEVLL